MKSLCALLLACLLFFALIPHLKAQGGADNPPPPVVLTDEQGQYPLPWVCI
jgi:hypothetical protein